MFLEDNFSCTGEIDRDLHFNEMIESDIISTPEQ